MQQFNIDNYLTSVQKGTVSPFGNAKGPGFGDFAETVKETPKVAPAPNANNIGTEEVRKGAIQILQATHQ